MSFCLTSASPANPGFSDQVIALGEGLRDAERSLDGPALRELCTQRRALVRSLTARARKLAQPAGSESATR